MSWHKIWLVLRREYAVNFRRPAFLLTAFGVPLFSMAAMFFLFRFMMDRETNLDAWQRIAYLDRAGIVRVDAPNPDGFVPFSDPDLVRPEAEGDLPAYFDALQDIAREQVLADEIDAVFVIPADYVLTGRVDLFADKGVPEALFGDLKTFMLGQIMARAPQDLAVPTELLTGQDITLRDIDSDKALSEEQLVGRILLPFLFVLIYFMATNTTAQFLMSGVVEEKENRLMEILATSLRPQELLWGKLLGLASLALTQIVLWASATVVIAGLNEGAREFLTSVSFAATDILLLLCLFVISFFLFSATMLALGASVTAEAESRQIAGIFSFVTVLPLALSAVYMTNPDGALPVFFTFFPYTGAVSLILRLSLTHLPLWQIILSGAIQLASVFAVMWLAAKVFRLGMLMYGKRLTPRAVWHALLEGRQVMTTASTMYGDVAQSADKKARKKKGWLGR